MAREWSLSELGWSLEGAGSDCKSDKRIFRAYIDRMRFVAKIYDYDTRGGGLSG